MKKLVAFLLALTLMLSLSVTAFAEDQKISSLSDIDGIHANGEQTITVNSPALSWILKIPANFEITKPDETLLMGTVEITNVSRDLPNNSLISADVYYTGYLTEDGSQGAGTRAEYALISKASYSQQFVEIKHEVPTSIALYLGANYEENYSCEMYVCIAQVQWDKLTPGKSYSEKVSYSSHWVQP